MTPLTIKNEINLFINKYGNPMETNIPNWFKRLFLPKEYYLIREFVYAELKYNKKKK